ncbi:MAG: alpha-amylase family glycosyl hydrolase, partial [Nostoc sp.]
DMFDNPGCVWEFGPINRKIFEPYNKNHPSFLLIRQLAEIRFQNRLIQSGNRTLLCSRNNGLWCVLIHSAEYEQPLFIAMNLGATPVLEEAFKIPNWYGEFWGVDMLIATSGGVFHLVEGGMRIKLPPFTFVLGRLLQATSKAQE